MLIMETDVIDELQKLGQRRKTGCLQVIAKHTNDGTTINVFLKAGLIVYCEARGIFKVSVGLQNLAYCLEWPNPDFKWIEERIAPGHPYQHETQTILFRIASIMSNKENQGQRLSKLFSSDKETTTSYFDNPNDYGFSLHVLDTEFSGMQFFILDNKSIIGRSESADFSIPHATLSSNHCEIRQESSGYMVLQDLGSTNGTHINEVLVQTSKLFDGDRITLGDVSIVFCVRSKFELMRQMEEDYGNSKLQISGVMRSVDQKVSNAAKKSMVEDTVTIQHPPVISVQDPQIKKNHSTSKILLDEITKRVNFWKKKKKEG